MVGPGPDRGSGICASRASEFHRGWGTCHHHQFLCDCSLSYRRGAVRARWAGARRHGRGIGARRGGESRCGTGNPRRRIVAALVRILSAGSVPAHARAGNPRSLDPRAFALGRSVAGRDPEFGCRGQGRARRHRRRSEALLGLVYAGRRGPGCGHAASPAFRRRRRRGRRRSRGNGRHGVAVQLQPARGHGRGAQPGGCCAGWLRRQDGAWCLCQRLPAPDQGSRGQRPFARDARRSRPGKLSAIRPRLDWARCHDRRGLLWHRARAHRGLARTWGRPRHLCASRPVLDHFHRGEMWVTPSPPPGRWRRRAIGRTHPASRSAPDRRT